MAQRTFAPDLIKASLCVSVGDCEDRKEGRKKGRKVGEGEEGGKE